MAPRWRRPAGSRLTAVAESQQAAGRAHRREPQASGQPPLPTIAAGDVAPFDVAPFRVLRGTAQRRV